MSLPVADAREVVQRLQPDLAIATGSACHSGSEEPSHVLLALGLTLADARRVVRVSVGRATTEEEICFAADALARVVQEVRQLEGGALSLVASDQGDIALGVMKHGAVS